MYVICSWAQGHWDSKTANNSRYMEREKVSVPARGPSPPHHVLSHLPEPGSQKRRLTVPLRHLEGWGSGVPRGYPVLGEWRQGPV